MIMQSLDGKIKLVFVDYRCELYDTVWLEPFANKLLSTTGDHAYAVDYFRKKWGRHLKSVSCLGYTFWRSIEDWG